MPTTHLLYLHGFRSSPGSHKAQRVAARVRDRHPGLTWWCPQLPASPRAAMELVLQGVAGWPRGNMAVIGSSLGGFYATHVAGACGCKAVLLNPAVHPARDLSRHIGEQTSWHNPDERFFFDPRFVDELLAIEAGPGADASRCFAVIAKGDELLDWREMTRRYRGARIKLLDGGDHALSDFDDHIDEVFDFIDPA